MRLMKAGLGIAAASLMVLAVAACEQGGAEKAGEKLDTAIEEADGGTKDMSDGSLEKAGEQLDKAASEAGEAIEGAAKEAGEAAEKAADKAKAATDGDKGT